MTPAVLAAAAVLLCWATLRPLRATALPRQRFTSPEAIRIQRAAESREALAAQALAGLLAQHAIDMTFARAALQQRYRWELAARNTRAAAGRS